ncbi:uncharacterized protein BCR38DRAFT_196031 [Pseudomassariella vexata]|uniref:Uncharacterized protein n=1 Tax=Pseudomassariella vexata TaxID=1141098 RepID=A0A1Y2E1D7_9PEZI|nr:uncharacterized protein BCR38DRAFT_196031 [Pseudomassariella vexata]ORY65363.1 hypothetical protein BCR38DRAFT_196031 [Pseudomassariella vexata]
MPISPRVPNPHGREPAGSSTSALMCLTSPLLEPSPMGRWRSCLLRFWYRGSGALGSSCDVPNYSYRHRRRHSPPVAAAASASAYPNTRGFARVAQVRCGDGDQGGLMWSSAGPKIGSVASGVVAHGYGQCSSDDWLLSPSRLTSCFRISTSFESAMYAACAGQPCCNSSSALVVCWCVVFRRSQPACFSLNSSLMILRAGFSCHIRLLTSHPVPSRSSAAAFLSSKPGLRTCPLHRSRGTRRGTETTSTCSYRCPLFPATR